MGKLPNIQQRKAVYILKFNYRRGQIPIENYERKLRSNRKSIFILNHPMKQSELLVFPSNEKTISVENDPVYGGAHKYEIRHSLGFEDGEPVYNDETTTIQFVQKNEDGSVISGFQSEQLVLAILDRTQKLNNKLPSPQNEKMIAGLQMFLDACEERVSDRINRGVMGKLKN